MNVRRFAARAASISMAAGVLLGVTGLQATGAEPITASGSFSALTYNVAGLPAGLSGSEPDINTPYISPLLNPYDLVLVQEDWANPDPPIGISVYHEILVADATHPYQSDPAPVPLGSNPVRPSALVSDGLNRLSRLPFGPVTRTMWEHCFGGADTSDGGAADCLSTKGFSVASTELAPGISIDVYNLHGEAGNTPTDQTYRAEGYAVLADYITTHSAGRAVLIGGDFNLHTDRSPDGEVFADLLAAAGLTDVCAVVDCGTESDRIDKFVFRSGGGVTLTPVSHAFEADTFVRPTDGAPLSDHEPLHVGWEWTFEGTPTTTTTLPSDTTLPPDTTLSPDTTAPQSSVVESSTTSVPAVMVPDTTVDGGVLGAGDGADPLAVESLAQTGADTASQVRFGILLVLMGAAVLVVTGRLHAREGARATRR